MPRDNPSFIVLIIPNRDDVAKADADISGYLQGEEGRSLTWLGDNRYALARATLKQLGVGLDGRQLRARVDGLRGVTDVQQPKATDVLAAYKNRVSGDEPQASATAEQRDWNLRMINAPQAWALFEGGVARKPWRAVRVAHLDTGYTEHPVYGDWTDHRNATLRPHEGINYVDQDSGEDGGTLRSTSAPLDPLTPSGQPGHGTRTCSVLAGEVPGKFSGVAPGVTVVPYRVTSHVVIDSVLGEGALEKAIIHAVEHNNCDIISISLGDPCFPKESVGKAIDKAYEAGVIVAAAAGNITSEVTYPGRFSRAVTAGGVTANRVPWTGGSRGKQVDVSAPAENVSRANAIGIEDPGGPTPGPEERRDGQIRYVPKYIYGHDGDGTSYATVHVAGAAALWLAYHVDKLDRYPGWKRVEAFRKLVKATAQRPDGWQGALFGAGILDIEALLKAPLPNPANLVKCDTKAEDQCV